uniref:NOP2/Sun RNA methyltransferase 6 n=1 Tax=Hucho hucho TaxID=62062 RepID=A0A4W5MMM5_9TELE
GAQCGSNILRGAHVFALIMKTGDAVSFFSDLEVKCTLWNKDFQGESLTVFYGVSDMDHTTIFCSDKPARCHLLCPSRCVGIWMVEPLYQSPSFVGVLPSLAFLQVPLAHPGHVCCLMGEDLPHCLAKEYTLQDGEVWALDKIRGKVQHIHQNTKALHLDCLKAHCFNSTKAVCTYQAQDTESPLFPPLSSLQQLLDAPCSSLGQSPCMACTWSLEEICSYQPLQRKLFYAAVRLLKCGGVLVYSSCTVTLAENEEQVAWAPQHLPLPQTEPHIGVEGILQRFSPELGWSVAEARAKDGPTQQPESPTPTLCAHQPNKDTIGFFIAKFLKS